MFVNKFNMLALIVVFFLGYPFYLWCTYIDETITEGEAYELQIGSTKEEVYRQLPVSFKNIKKEGQRVFVLVKSNNELSQYLATNPDFDIMVSPFFHEVGFNKFSEKDNWDFYINASYNDVLKIKFCDEKLCSIHRHRKLFELP